MADTERMPDDGNGIADRLRCQQKALAEFGLHAFRSTDLDDILHRATELVAEGLDVELTKVLELLPGGDTLLVRAGVNWRPGVVGHTRFGAGENSPAGHALLHDEPVVSPDLAAETRFAIPPVLVEHGVRSMVNVPIPGQASPFGVLEVDTPRRRRFDEDDIAFLRTYANLLAAAVGRHRAHSALEDGLREQKVLIRELQHRVKNMLGLIQSLARQTTAEAEDARAFRDTFVDRLQALARAENLVFQDHAQHVEFGRLVATSIEPFADGGRAFSVEGGTVMLPARIGRIMGLVLHELGTNAAKHGALSAPDGRVRIGWSVEGPPARRRLAFHWSESGAPAVGRPGREGFGTRLLTSLTAYELDGDASLEHAPGGLRYRLVFPLDAD